MSRFKLRVVASGDGVEPQTLRPFKEQVELDDAIAFNTGIGCQPSGVISDKGFDHGGLKLLGVVKDVVVDSEHMCHAPSVIDIRDRTTSRIAWATPQLQGDANHVVSGFAQQGGGDRGVNSPRHCDHDFHVVSLPAGWYGPYFSPRSR